MATKAPMDLAPGDRLITNVGPLEIEFTEWVMVHEMKDPVAVIVRFTDRTSVKVPTDVMVEVAG